MSDTVAIDMFVVATATFQLLYGLLVLGHGRRKVIHFNVAPNPTQVWLARQITEAFPWDTAPRFLLRDRDASYGPTFRARVQAMAIEEVVTAPSAGGTLSVSSPQQDASLAPQGLPRASVGTATLCRHRCCIPTGRRTASSLRAARSLNCLR